MIGSSNGRKDRAWPEPRLRDLPADQDLAGVSELIRAAAPLPPVSALARQRMRARLRQSLRSGIRRRARWWAVLRPAAIALAGLMIASAGGAAVYTVMSVTRSMRGAAVAPVNVPGRAKGKRRSGRLSLGTRPAAPAAEDGFEMVGGELGVGDQQAPPASTEPVPGPARVPPAPLPTPFEGRAPAIAIPAPSAPRREPEARRAVSVEQVPAGEVAPVMVAEQEPPARLGPPQLASPPTLPALPGGPAEAPAAPRATIAPASDGRAAPPSETELLAGALHQLRAGGNPEAALAALDEHTARFPRSALAAEVAAVRIEALLKAGRAAAALAELDRSSLDGTPGYDARLVVRGELRAQMARWAEAEADFSRALAARLDSARDDLAERALWGRSAALAHLGDAAGARDSSALYLRRFPEGRFSRQARALAHGPSPATVDDTTPREGTPGRAGNGTAVARPALRPPGER